VNRFVKALKSASQKSEAAAIGLIVAVSSATSFWGLKTWSINYEEALSLYLSNAPLAVALRCDIHPPIFYGWTKIVGLVSRSLWAHRFACAFFAFLLPPLVYTTARRWGRKKALFASIATAFSPLRVWSAHYLRPYALLPFLALLAFRFFSHFLETKRKTPLIFVWLFLTMALLTHATALVIFPAFMGIIPLLPRRLRGPSVAALLGALAPFAIFTVLLTKDAPPTVRNTSLIGGILGFLFGATEPFAALSTISRPSSWWGLEFCLSQVVALGLLWSIWKALSKGKLSEKIVAGSVISSAFGIAIAGGLGFIHPLGRYTIVSLPFYFLALSLPVLAGPANKIGRSFLKIVPWLTIGLELVCLSHSLEFSFHFADYRGLVKELQTKARPKAVVVFDTPELALVFRLYLSPERYKFLPSAEVWNTRKGYFMGLLGRPFSKLEAGRYIEREIGKCSEVWAIIHPRRLWPNILEGKGFEEVYRKEAAGFMSKVVLCLYRKKEERCGAQD